MRRLIVLGAALAMMAWLSYLRVDVDLGTGDPLTLAAIGFTILAAYSVGELGTVLGLPKVTGYILAGILLGPQVSAILGERVVGDMGMFKNLALGLIATTAGLELNLKAIKAVWKTLVSTVIIKIPLLIIMVGGVTMAIQTFHPFFALEGQANLAFALILAILGIGTSPAIALAVVSDSKAKGRLTDILLGIAVVKDLVVVVSLALGIALANALLTPDAAMDAGVLIHVGEELLFSILVGLVVGALLIAYIRFIKAEMLLFVLVMVLLVIEVSALLHLELLLVFIVAGFLVRNFSPYEHDLLDPLEQVSLPIFVVFFTVAGSEVQLQTTWAILPMALALVAARAAAFWISANLGSRFGSEADPVRKNAWLTYLPQAGVTLGLVFLAADKIEALSGPITEMGMALVAIHLLVGPVTTGLGLKRAGEVGKAGGADAHGHGSETEAHGGPAPQAKVAEPTPVEDPEVPLPLLSPKAIAATVTHPEVAEVIEGLGERLFAEVDVFVKESVTPIAQAHLTLLNTLLGDESSHARRLKNIGQALSPSKNPLVGDSGDASWEGSGIGFYLGLAEVIQSLPIRFSVDQDTATLYGNPGESLRMRLAKAFNLMAFRLGLKKQRHLSLRLAGRVACEPSLASMARTLEGSWYRTWGALLALLEQVVVGQLGAEEALSKARNLLSSWQSSLELELRRGVQAGIMELATSVTLLGTPATPNSSLRYSKVEPKVHAALQRLRREESLWPKRMVAAEENIQAFVQVELAAIKVHGALQARGHTPLDEMASTFGPMIDTLCEKLESLRERSREPGLLDVGTLEQFTTEVKVAYARSEQVQLRRARSRFRRAVQTNRLIADLTSLTQALPKTLFLIAERTPLADATRPDTILTWTTPIAERVETSFFEELVPGFTQALQRVSELISTSHGRLESCIQPVVYALELVQRGGLEDDKSRSEAIIGAFDRACQRFDELRKELEEQVQESHDSLHSLFRATTDGLKSSLKDDAQAPSTRVEESVRATQRLALDLVSRIGQSIRDRGLVVGLAARRLGGQKRLLDLRISTGREILDAVEIRRYLDTWVTHPFDLPLPPVYTRLFSIKTMDDRRFLVAHRAQLREALEIIAAPRGAAYAASVLVIGNHGSGRTSFLNSLQLRLGQGRVLRMDDTFASREEGIVAALAAELSTAPTPEAIVETLGTRQTDVLIDNLERWILPSPSGIEDLKRLARIMVEGSTNTRWVVTLESNALASLSPLVPLERIFTHTVELGPLSWEELAEAVDTRDRIGGFQSEYSKVRTLSPAHFFRGEKEAYFRTLAKVSEGNLRAALLAHLRALTLQEDGTLSAGTPASLGLPFLSQLTAEALATLSLIARYGPMSPPELSLALVLPEEQVQGTLTYLIAAELLEATGSGGGKVQVPPHVGPALFMGLGHAHVLIEKGAL